MAYGLKASSCNPLMDELLSMTENNTQSSELGAFSSDLINSVQVNRVVDVLSNQHKYLF